MEDFDSQDATLSIKIEGSDAYLQLTMALRAVVVQDTLRIQLFSIYGVNQKQVSWGLDNEPKRAIQLR